MTKKVLAASNDHRIVACFKNEIEYNEFCGLIMTECVDNLMKSLSLEEIISLWNEKNAQAVTETAGSVNSF